MKLGGWLSQKIQRTVGLKGLGQGQSLVPVQHQMQKAGRLSQELAMLDHQKKLATRPSHSQSRLLALLQVGSSKRTQGGAVMMGVGCWGQRLRVPWMAGRQS